MANTYLTKTFSSSPTNAKKGTVSLWFKLSQAASGNTYNRIFTTGTDSSNRTDINIDASNGRLNFTAGLTNNTSTNRLLRDESAFYHLVISYDTTQATASDRVKFYINGVQETSFSETSYPSQNADLDFGNNSSAHHIGNSPHFSPRFFHGIMSHFHYVDGTAYDATAFGEYDANGVWKINTSPSVTYGTNGFFILKNGNSVTDQSGNSNNFTVGGGTLTNTEDNPSNVFSTFNPLAQTTTKGTLSNGNLTYDRPGASDNWVTVFGTEAFTQGKYYYEYKIIDGGASSGNGSIVGLINYDISDIQNKSLTHIGGNTGDGGMGWYGAGNLFTSSGDQGIFSSYTDGDIVMVAVDSDNGYAYWGKNGSWINSGDPTSGATGTGGFALSLAGSNGTYCFGVSHREGGNGSANFGNGYFGTTAVASAGTNASGIGIFEYDVPTGYTALSTKGLNE